MLELPFSRLVYEYFCRKDKQYEVAFLIPKINHPKAIWNMAERIISTYTHGKLFVYFHFLGKMVVTDAETIKYK